MMPSPAAPTRAAAQGQQHPEQIVGTGTTYSAPSMTTDGNNVNITATGTGQSLWFYWAVNGSSTWHPEQV
jgi:hypothetical protein